MTWAAVAAFFRKVPGWLWAVAGIAAAIIGVHLQAKHAGREEERELDELEDMRQREETRRTIDEARAERIEEMIEDEIELSDDIERIVEEGSRRLRDRPISDAGKDREVQEALKRARERWAREG